jgi:hypothetical protein
VGRENLNGFFGLSATTKHRLTSNPLMQGLTAAWRIGTGWAGVHARPGREGTQHGSIFPCGSLEMFFKKDHAVIAKCIEECHEVHGHSVVH